LLIPVPPITELLPWHEPQVLARFARLIVDLGLLAGSIVAKSPLTAWQSRQLAAFLPL
jgi:hypothetical protein